MADSPELEHPDRPDPSSPPSLWPPPFEVCERFAVAGNMWFGWVAPERGDPHFVVQRAGLALMKLQATWPLTAEGWRAAWSDLCRDRPGLAVAVDREAREATAYVARRRAAAHPSAPGPARPSAPGPARPEPAAHPSPDRPDTPAPVTADGSDPLAALERLGALHRDGVLDDGEFARLKARILDDLGT